jgi:ATP-dependent protease ClpP protease subunit
MKKSQKLFMKSEDYDTESTVSIVHPPAFQYYSNVNQAVEHWFYISSAIRDPSEYTDMTHTIRSASQYDTIYICLNTPGGRLDTGIQLVNAMRASQASIVAVLEAEASSMGAILFLAADQHIVHENCRMMFHDFSGGASSGKGNEQFKELTAAIQLYNKLMKNVCVPFLSEDEVDRIIKGEDFWMDSDEITKRLELVYKQREEPEIEVGEVVVEPSKVKRSKKMKPAPTPPAEIPVEAVVEARRQRK